MDWKDAGIRDALRVWLREIAGSARVSERSLDPFATSMRNFDDVAADLRRIRQKGVPEKTDSTQRLRDLRAAGLVGASGQLTEFGRGTIASWDRFNVGTTDIGDELARHLVFVFEGVAHSDEATEGHLEYWAELREQWDPLALIQRWEVLHHISYLDFQRGGFTPGEHYRAIKASIDEILKDVRQFPARFSDDAEAVRGADRLLTTIDAKIPRARHRATYCSALELYIAGSGALQDLMRTAGIPVRPGEWREVGGQNRERLETILEAYDEFSGSRHGGFGAEEVAKESHESDKAGAGVERGSRGVSPGEVDFEQCVVPPPSGDTGERRGDGGARQRGGQRRPQDHTRRAERNTRIGDLGERLAMEYERYRLRGQPHLRDRIERVSLNDESAGYDIVSFEPDGSRRLVEVKTTTGPAGAAFFVSHGELKASQVYAESYVLLRIYDILGMPKMFELRGALDRRVSLEPQTYLAWVGRSDDM